MGIHNGSDLITKHILLSTLFSQQIMHMSSPSIAASSWMWLIIISMMIVMVAMTVMTVVTTVTMVAMMVTISTMTSMSCHLLRMALSMLLLRELPESAFQWSINILTPGAGPWPTLT